MHFKIKVLFSVVAVVSVFLQSRALRVHGHNSTASTFLSIIAPFLSSIRHFLSCHVERVFYFVTYTPLLPCSHFYTVSVSNSCLYGCPAAESVKECISHTVKISISYDHDVLVTICIYTFLHWKPVPDCIVDRFRAVVFTCCSPLIGSKLCLFFIFSILVAVSFCSRCIEYTRRKLSEL